MAWRAAVLRWPTAGAFAAASAAVTGVAFCEKDVKGPSFDPEALERGAKALREINNSPYAKKVLPRGATWVSAIKNSIWIWSSLFSPS